MSLNEWLIFVTVWTLAALPLGPNALNCIVLSLSSGFHRSLYAVLGILAAVPCHIAASAFGLSALLLANAALFQMLKWVGVAYLLWLALSMLLAPGSKPAIRTPAAASAGQAFRRGFLTSITNVQSVFVYLALFPHFIDPAEPLLAQMALIVPTILGIVGAVYVGYCASGRLLHRAVANARARVALDCGAAGAYLLAALSLSWFDPKRA